MANVMGYICVAVIGLAISVYAIMKKRDSHKVSTYIVFFAFSSSITWIGEFVVLGLFNSYAYKTGLFEDIWAQNLLGHLFLNISMFPAAVIVKVAFSLRYGYFAITSAVFVLVELVFEKIGLYEQHWWRYYMSVINVCAFLLIAEKWFSKMNRERYGLIRALTFYFFSFLFLHLPTPILLLLDKQHFQLDLINNLVNNYYRSSIMVSFSYHLIINAVYVFFICVLGKWYWKLVPFIISPVVFIVFVKMNILIIHGGWNLIYYILLELMMITIFILFEKYTLKPNEGCVEKNQ